MVKMNGLLTSGMEVSQIARYVDGDGFYGERAHCVCLVH